MEAAFCKALAIVFNFEHAKCIFKGLILMYNLELTSKLDGRPFSQRLALEECYSEMKAIFDKSDWIDNSLKGSCILSWSVFLENWLHHANNSTLKSQIHLDLPNIKQLWRDKYGQDAKIFEFLSDFVHLNRSFHGENVEIVGNCSSGNYDILKDLSSLNLEALE